VSSFPVACRQFPVANHNKTASYKNDRVKACRGVDLLFKKEWKVGFSSLFYWLVPVVGLRKK